MYIKVRVIASAKHEKVEVQGNDHLKIWVKEPAKQNLANKRVVELVAAHFKVPANKARILSGHHSPSKLLSIAL